MQKQTAKQTSFIEYYCNPASETYNNGVKSAIRAGYSEKTINSAMHQILSNIAIRQGIDTYKAKTVRIVEHDRQHSLHMLQTDYDLLKVKADEGNIQAIGTRTAITREMNSISGLHTQTIINETQTEELDETDKAEAKRLATLRLADNTPHAGSKGLNQAKAGNSA